MLDQPRSTQRYVAVPRDGDAHLTLKGILTDTRVENVALLSPAAKAQISGYHSASGRLAANQELAKQRAFTVRDALLAADLGKP